ncbi:YaiO family outer membrane beta-barrel protein [Flagellimonas meishanensis]|uniref:YaiO family outer membrane beta-barrel protein n=1 Tax=Flagellimonas meishanensis TaxID=2873264 RepID=UPI001CA687F1|nr:YaiO family outer membrane beta-barrel protein [[Muricauda] meishanensis]
MTKYLWMFGLLLCIGTAWSQENITADEMFMRARKEAFEKKNYPEAIALMTIATQKVPENIDFRIFLGRLYTWDGQMDKAKNILEAVFEENKNYEDAALAYASLEYWDKNPETALEIVNKGLEHNEDSESLLVLKAKILMTLKNYREASGTLDKTLEYHPKSTTACSLFRSIGTGSVRNEAGVSYSFVHFKERFDQPWHLASLHYGRWSGLGPIFGRFNYGNRFGTGTTQFEVDFYPRISNTFYAYLNGGVSSDKGIFPEYRAGLSLYANLPAAFEADAGFRLLKFTDATWVYAFGLGKYYKNYWFNFRSYLSMLDDGVADAHAFTTRYYFGGADDYFSVSVGAGFSPDNSTNNILLGNSTRLRSNNITAGFRKLLGDTHVIYSEIAYDRIEFAADSRDDQYSLRVGYIKRF